VVLSILNHPIIQEPVTQGHVTSTDNPDFFWRHNVLTASRDDRDRVSCIVLVRGPADGSFHAVLAGDLVSAFGSHGQFADTVRA
jgi:hypothetical protein